MDRELRDIAASGQKPSLLLQACCAPCSSYVLEYLSGYFDITLFFYNPNISPREEFEKRFAELQRLISQMPLEGKVSLIEGNYDPERFFAFAEGMASLKEGGERCFRCYRLRLEEAARYAAEGGFSYFSTTLSISPHKNAEKLNEIGGELAGKYGVPYLFSDFKKKNGYRRSCQLSAEYGLYRQSYCGCVYSREQARQEGRL